MQSLRRFTNWLGSLPLLGITWGLAAALSLWAVSDVMVFQLSSGLANSTYDAMIRARIHAPPHDSRIVILDIDESSLQTMAKEFGRWPWSRDTLATVLDHIEKQQPEAIAWDMIFSDADRLSPGGDKAFDEAVSRSKRSLFSVVRLPAQYDTQSQLTATQLPGLWLTHEATGAVRAALAAIPPVLPAVAAAQLGYNNGYPDADGVLRRYRYTETLADGSRIQSLAHAVARIARKDHVDSNAGHRIYADTYSLLDAKKDDLIVWRSKVNSYPRIPFAQVFEQAEGAKQAMPISFQGKIVLIGSTASSLHDIHPTPLGAQHAGVDALATAMDNAINGNHLTELPAALQGLLAVILVSSMAVWALKRGLASIQPALLPLPVALLAISYLSLNFGSLFIDLHLAAGVALLFVAALKLWNGWRRNHWCSEPISSGHMAMIRVDALEPITDNKLDQLIRLLELNASACRIIGGDASAVWPSILRWPSLLCSIVIAGPAHQLHLLSKALIQANFQCSEPIATESQSAALAAQARQLLALQP